MTRLTLQLDDLVVSSFTTQELEFAAAYGKICTGDISTCPRTSPEGGCVCTADNSTCPRTSPEGGCNCTADISTCPRTGFDTQCGVFTVATADLN